MAHQRQAGPLYVSSDEAMAAVSEAEWQRTLVGLFKTHGWRIYHTKFSIKSDPGYPDLTLVHPVQQRTVWVEVKKMGGKVSPAQAKWLDAIVAAGGEAYVLRPKDWDLAVRIAQERVA